MTEAIVTLNAGSSSIKFKVFARGSLDQLMAGKVTGIGSCAALELVVANAAPERQELGAADHDSALATVLEAIDRHDDGLDLTAVAHRVVHGGDKFAAPVIVDDAVFAKLHEFVPLAPLHQPHNLAGIVASRELARSAVDVACFDTAFHAGQARLFHSFALPRQLYDQGIRKYGFHGLSYEWLSRRLAEDHPRLAEGRVVAAHLGNGASLCALAGGESVDTTMGMTALDGLPMGTRCGAVDPGVVAYLARSGRSIEDIEALLYNESGLLGLSGMTNDVAALLSSDDPRATFALDYFTLKVAQYTAMMAVSLGGLDALVFTAGIGENAAPIREDVVRRLAFLQPFETLVIPTDEERMMVLHAREVLEEQSRREGADGPDHPGHVIHDA